MPSNEGFPHWKERAHQKKSNKTNMISMLEINLYDLITSPINSQNFTKHKIPSCNKMSLPIVEVNYMSHMDLQFIAKNVLNALRMYDLCTIHFGKW
jgi:hypothetical protein